MPQLHLVGYLLSTNQTLDHSINTSPVVSLLHQGFGTLVIEVAIEVREVINALLALASVVALEPELLQNCYVFIDVF